MGTYVQCFWGHWVPLEMEANSFVFQEKVLPISDKCKWADVPKNN